MIVRVPLKYWKWRNVFSKNKTLDVKFFRRVSSADTIATKFSGFYESIDMTSYAYHKVNYTDGIKGKEFRSQSLKPQKSTVAGNKDLIVSQSSGSWFSALIYCMGHYIFSIPKRGPDGEWGCSVLGGEGDGDNDENGDEDGDELPPYFPIIYPPNPPSLPPGYNPPPANTPPPVVWYPIILDPYNNFTIELDPDFLFNYLDVPFAWTY